MIFYQTINSKSGTNNDIEIFDDFEFISHMHRDLEFILVLEGSITLTVEEKVRELTKGQTAMVFSNQIHSYLTKNHSRVLIHVFSPDNVRSFTHMLENRIGKEPVFRCDDEIKEYYYKACVEKNRRTPLAIKSYLYAICDRYLADCELTEVPKGSSDIIHLMLRYISEHFRENITLGEMAENFGYEAHYLSRVFSSSVNINLRKYINQYRVDYAKYLLSETEQSITDVAMNSGFQSIRNFNRVFSEFEGISPQVFRAQRLPTQPA